MPLYDLTVSEYEKIIKRLEDIEKYQDEVANELLKINDKFVIVSNALNAQAEINKELISKLTTIELELQNVTTKQNNA